MTADPYNARVREYFAAPAHSGEVEGGASGYFADQGLRIRLSASVVGGVIQTMRFRAWGCPHVLAAAEAVCRRFEGSASTGLADFSTAQLMQELAIPVEKTGRILVLEDTVRSLWQSIQDGAQTGKPPHS